MTISLAPYVRACAGWRGSVLRRSAARLEALGVVAELALEDADAIGFEQQILLIS